MSASPTTTNPPAATRLVTFASSILAARFPMPTAIAVTAHKASVAAQKTTSGARSRAANAAGASCVRSPHSATNTTPNPVVNVRQNAAPPPASPPPSPLGPPAPPPSSSWIHITAAETRNTTPAPTWTARTGSSENRMPAATATMVCTPSARAAPKKTGSCLCLVARTSAARAVLSGSSATKMTPKTQPASSRACTLGAGRVAQRRPAGTQDESVLAGRSIGGIDNCLAHLPVLLFSLTLPMAAAPLRIAANALWPLVRAFNARFERASQHPKWAPATLLKRGGRTYPPLGWPRETDSLCPQCVVDVRSAILEGRADVRVLVEDKPGEIRATIAEVRGELLMSKTCAKHGRIEDVLSVDPAFSARIEKLFPGRDFLAPASKLRNHGSSSIKYGRGSVLTVDLTNRCNMMCDPCFMDANQVGFVHELGWEEVQRILDDAIRINAARQMSVQFSGGEPTLSPHFLRAIQDPRRAGYFCVQCATNGIRFAQDREFARAAKRAGLRLAYLQFDGIGEEANAHRKVGNLFDVKLRAIENLHAEKIDVVLVVTVVRGVNDDQVGQVVRFAIENADKITVVAFQPVSFTGRDEGISDDERRAKRYTLSHLAHDLKAQTGVTE